LTGKAPIEPAVIQNLTSLDAIDFSPDGKTLVSGHYKRHDPSLEIRRDKT